MTKELQKTHWLQNQNKKYLGHYDFPNGNDVILTIKSAQQEEVENHSIIIDKKPAKEIKRVVRFEENNSWVKPFICNQVNAQAIIKCTGEKFMEDCIGKKIKLGVSQTKVMGEEVDCIRVRNISSKVLGSNKINSKQSKVISDLIVKAGFDEKEWCKSVNVTKVSDLAKIKFNSFVKRLNEIISEKNADNN